MATPPQSPLAHTPGHQCDMPFTYQIDGKVVVPLGHGDLHDPYFDRLMWHGSFRNVTRVEDGTAEGLHLHQDECPYSIRVYPSHEFEGQYYTSTPTIVTVAVALVFVFTCAYSIASSDLD